METIKQEYEKYSAEDHNTWATLCDRQQKLWSNKVSPEYQRGYKYLRLDRNRIARIEEVSKSIEAVSGWTLIPVTGLIATRDFFYMLINKRYPVTVSIRRANEIDFSEQPDIFHDVFGHLPLLTNEKFTKFLTSYSTIALRYINNERAVEYLGRLYWYTYEMGLISAGDGFRAYGGAIITSAQEMANVFKNSTPKHKFELSRVFNSSYNPFDLQKEYFVIESFDQLFDCLSCLEEKLIEYLLLDEPDHTIRNYRLNHLISREFNNVIGFLNDVQYRFPSAISFAAGQPDDKYFDVEQHLSKIGLFINYLAAKTGSTREDAIGRIGQYNMTKGIINDIIAEYLHRDENLNLSSDNLLITVGAQEAFAIIVSTVCNRESDVILVEDPGYIGVSSFAKVFGYKVEGVPVDDEGMNLKALKNTIITINGTGHRVKLVYVIPDYQNPSGHTMPIGNRLKLLELARMYNFLIIEDSVYNSFTYAQKRQPALKSLDRFRRVIFVGSFSKLLFPGLRVGLLAADQLIEDEQGSVVPLINEMIKVKAQLTNNTSALSQAVLGGVLLDLNFSLSDFGRAKYSAYKLKRDTMIFSLKKYFRPSTDWAKGVEWNEPDGGFFIKMTVPFIVDNKGVLECADEFGVVFCPMKYFYVSEGGENEIRLAFSNLSVDEIDLGIKRLAEFVKARASRLEQAHAETIVELHQRH